LAELHKVKGRNQMIC